MARQRDLRVVSFKDVTTIEMNVDGTDPIPDKVYRVVAPAGETWMGARIRLIIADATSWPLLGFGAGASPLSTGLLFRKQQLASPTTVWSWNLTRNYDLYERFECKSRTPFSDTRETSVFEFEAPADMGFEVDEDNALEFLVRDNLAILDGLRALFIHGV